MFQVLSSTGYRLENYNDIGSIMTLTLTSDEKIARLRADLRMGAGFIVKDNNNAWILASAETLCQARFEKMQKLGSLELVLTERRASVLSTWAQDGLAARLRVPDNAKLDWIRAVSDPSNDLNNTMKGPFQLSQGRSSPIYHLILELCKKSGLLPAFIIAPFRDSSPCDLTQVSVEEISAGLKNNSPLHLVSSARLPLSVARDAQVHVFRPQDGGIEHYAIEIGRPSREKPVLSRLHSACFTGDLIGSLKCDCGAQLKAALEQMGRETEGILLYLNQEGRGIGLANKMRAYSLQNQGFDTVDANHRLGFEDDERDFTLGSDILRSLGFKAVRLMTNNPAKVKKLRQAGIEVTEFIPLKVGKTPENKDYLATKAAKSGHLL